MDDRPVGVRVDPVHGNRDLHSFLTFPWQVYRGNPHWVPPLLMDVKDVLHVKHNPFWMHARRELFLARRDGRIVGRIAAIVDDRHNLFHREKTGFFGFFEALPDESASGALFNEAAEWVRSYGMERLRGPVNPSMNDECGFLSAGFDLAPAIMMPYTPPYYLTHAERAGFVKAKELWSWYKPTADPLPERYANILDKVARRAGARLRPINMKRFNEELVLFKELYNASWEHNWGFVPMTDEEIDYMAKKMKPLIVPDLITILEVEGRPAGMMLSLPDYNEVFAHLNGRLFPFGLLKFLWYRRKIRRTRLMAMGLRPEYRGKGLDVVFYAEALRTTGRLGYAGGELSWTLEDNDLINRGIIAMNCPRTTTHRLVEKVI